MSVKARPRAGRVDSPCPWRNPGIRVNVAARKSTARGTHKTMARRIIRDNCWGAVIDVQEFFLSQVNNRLRAQIKSNTRNFIRLLDYFRIPMVVTLEKPVYQKGPLPKEIDGLLSGTGRYFEKYSFDLTKEKAIRDYIASLKKKQVIVAGCETDVCVLQSCLGLLDLGYEVFVVEELLFSSARDVESAIARMKAEGVVFLSYKTLYYELIEAVDGGRHAQDMLATYGPFPDDLPDSAIEWPFVKTTPHPKGARR